MNAKLFSTAIAVDSVLRQPTRNTPTSFKIDFNIMLMYEHVFPNCLFRKVFSAKISYAFLSSSSLPVCPENLFRPDLIAQTT